MGLEGIVVVGDGMEVKGGKGQIWTSCMHSQSRTSWHVERHWVPHFLDFHRNLPMLPSLFSHLRPAEFSFPLGHGMVLLRWTLGSLRSLCMPRPSSSWILNYYIKEISLDYLICWEGFASLSRTSCAPHSHPIFPNTFYVALGFFHFPVIHLSWTSGS